MNEITQMVDLARNGDREAYGALVTRFEPTVYAVALARLRNATEAQELTQDVFIHAMRKLTQLKESAAFAGWLRQITVRMAINRLTRRGPVTKVEDEVLQAVEAKVCNPLETMLAGERAAELYEALDRLKPVDRATLIAFYIRGRTLKQMVREFETPIGTIKRRLHVARNRLKEALTGVAEEA